MHFSLAHWHPLSLIFVKSVTVVINAALKLFLLFTWDSCGNCNKNNIVLVGYCLLLLVVPTADLFMRHMNRSTIGTTSKFLAVHF